MFLTIAGCVFGHGPTSGAFLILAGSVCRISQEYSSLFYQSDLNDFCV